MYDTRKHGVRLCSKCHIDNADKREGSNTFPLIFNGYSNAALARLGYGPLMMLGVFTR